MRNNWNVKEIYTRKQMLCSYFLEMYTILVNINYLVTITHDKWEIVWWNWHCCIFVKKEEQYKLWDECSRHLQPKFRLRLLPSPALPPNLHLFTTDLWAPQARPDLPTILHLMLLGMSRVFGLKFGHYWWLRLHRHRPGLV